MSVMAPIEPSSDLADATIAPVPGMDSIAIDDLVREATPPRLWPEQLGALYREKIVERIYSEQHFLFALGFLVCLATLAIDYAVDPALVTEGFVLRMFTVGPLTLLGMYAASKRWTYLMAVCIGAAPIAFASIIVYLAMQMPAENTAQYLTATALIVGLANVTMPYSMRWLAAFDLAFITAAFGTLALNTQFGVVIYLDYLLLLLVVAGSTLPITYRIKRLRQRNFLLDLRMQAISDELKQANLQLRELSERDPLTGMANRRYFDRVFSKEVATISDGSIAEHMLTGGRIAVMMIDLDRFKHFNDTHGHQAGDQCLALVSAALEDIFTGKDRVIARYGGEEFIAALREREHGEAEKLAEDVRATIEGLLLPVDEQSRSLITASIGLALAGANTALTREDMIEMADAALYGAKRDGRNRVETVEVDAPVKLRA